MNRHLIALPMLATILSLSGPAAAAAFTPAIVNDPRGDYRLIDGLPTNPVTKSIDISRVKFEKVDGQLKVTGFIRDVHPSRTAIQYMVAHATAPSGIKFLIQATTGHQRAYVAKQSWANEVLCTEAKSIVSGDTLVAKVPLKCLDRPSRLTRLGATTLVEEYSVAASRYYTYSMDKASGSAILRLR